LPITTPSNFFWASTNNFATRARPPYQEEEEEEEEQRIEEEEEERNAIEDEAYEFGIQEVEEMEEYPSHKEPRHEWKPRHQKPRSKVASEALKELLNISQNPGAYSEQVYYQDSELVVVYDKFPKARKHLLVLPKAQLEGPHVLGPQHLPLLESMHARGLWVQEQLKQEEPSLEFKMGFHAIPSMTQLHQHVISQDFDSVCLKNKKHWNTFTTPFFVDTEAMTRIIKENGKFDPGSYEEYEHQQMMCHRCEFPIRNIKSLKAHIRVCILGIVDEAQEDAKEERKQKAKGRGRRKKSARRKVEEDDEHID